MECHPLLQQHEVVDHEIRPKGVHRQSEPLRQSPNEDQNQSVLSDPPVTGGGIAGVGGMR